MSCEICHIEYKNQRQLRKHIRTNKKHNFIENMYSYLQYDDKFYCKICGISEQTVSKTRRHCDTDSHKRKIKKFKFFVPHRYQKLHWWCQICNQSYSTRQVLTHMHTGRF